MALDTAKTWDSIEGTETVTLTGGGSSTTVDGAKRRRGSGSQADRFLVTTGAWHLWVEKLGGRVPVPEWVITSGDGQKYRITAVFLESAGQRYRCECVGAK